MRDDMSRNHTLRSRLQPLTNTSIRRFACKVFNEFDLELQQECLYDHVQLYDGIDPEAPVLGKFCGNRQPEMVVASTNKLFVKFYSDASVQRRGFSATHSTGEPLCSDARTCQIFHCPEVD